MIQQIFHIHNSQYPFTHWLVAAKIKTGVRLTAFEKGIAQDAGIAVNGVLTPLWVALLSTNF
jgi:hypothetical protein